MSIENSVGIMQGLFLFLLEVLVVVLFGHVGVFLVGVFLGSA